MTNELSSKYAQQGLRKIFGFAVSNDPEHIYTSVRNRMYDRSSTSELLGHTTSQVISDAYSTYTGTDDHKTDKQANDTLTLLSAGVRDIYLILKNEFDKHPGMSPEQASIIAASPHTAKTIAQLALREQDNLGLLLAEHQTDPAYTLDATNNFLTPNNPRAATQQLGCPFAGHEGVVNPAPLFTRFVDWSGKLAIQHYYDQL